MAKLIPILLMVLGLAGGVGAGFMLRPAPEPLAEADEDAAPGPPEIVESATALYEFDNQFLIPIVEQGRVASILIIDLALEIDETAQEKVSAQSPLLRDRLLQILFDHANVGGFDGAFTSNNTMAVLRNALLEGAVQVLDAASVKEVLITNIMRNGS